MNRTGHISTKTYMLINKLPEVIQRFKIVSEFLSTKEFKVPS